MSALKPERLKYKHFSDGLFDTYKVQLRDNTYIVTRDGKELSVEELKQVVSGLQHNLEHRLKDISQAEMVEKGMRVKLNHMLANVKRWVVGSDADRFTWKPQQRTRVRNGNIECVYFATHSNVDNAVKIGFTSNLRQRTKGLYKTFDDTQVKILAYASTQDAQNLERLIHFHMKPCHIEGEWFDRAVVMQWVKDMAS